jgi:lambda family phage portal protein
MAVLDTLIATLSPRWALRRAQQRAALFEVQARYEGARRSRRTQGWRADGTGPQAEVEGALVELRNRARDLVRNNAWAAAGLDISVAYQVGYGITPRSRTGDADLDRQVNAEFEAWAKGCDIGGRLDFAGLMAQVARARAQDGEALTLKLPASPAEMRRRNIRVPLLLQNVEADLLEEDLEGGTASGTRIRQGIELSAGGAPLAYHLLEEHPGEEFGGRRGRVRIYQADAVLHLFRQDRPGQLRGVPDLAPFLLRLRDLDELEDAALHQAKVQACLAAFVTSGQPAGRGPLEAVPDGGGEPVRSFSPGMVERLLPGEDVRFAMPSGVGGFSDLARHQLHAIAASWGITYDLLTGDLTQANYSSLRAGRLAFKRRLEQIQWLLLIPRWCQPVWDAWIAAALRAGVLAPRAGGYPVEWGPPAFEMVDPLKDALAMQLMERLGYATWDQNVAAQGYDPEAQREALAKSNAEADRLGLILDGDPRRTAKAGGAQDAAQNAAVEIGATGAAVPRDPAAAMVQVVLSDAMGAALRAELAPAMASAEAAADAARAATAENAEALRDLRATADEVAMAMGDSRVALAGTAQQIAAAAASVAAAAERAAQPRTGVLVRDAQNRVTGVEYR